MRPVSYQLGSAERTREGRFIPIFEAHSPAHGTTPSAYQESLWSGWLVIAHKHLERQWNILTRCEVEKSADVLVGFKVIEEFLSAFAVADLTDLEHNVWYGISESR